MEKKDASQDEIDLLQLFLNFVLLIKKNFLLFLLFFMTGMLLGYVYSFVGTKVYESKMLVTSDILTELYVDEEGESLNHLLRENNTEILSASLGLSETEIGQVQSIDIEGRREKVTSPLIIPTFLLSISAKVTDQEILPKLQKGIISFLENNPYVTTRVDIKRKTNLELIRKIDLEIQSLEAFRKEIYEGKFLEKSEGDLMFDPTQVNSKIILLTQEKLNYQNLVQLVNSIQVVQDFVKHKHPVSPNTAISLAAGASLGLFFVFVLLAFKGVRGLVRIAEENQKQV